MTNEERANNAIEMLDHFPNSDPESLETTIIDALADLMHLCGQEDVDFYNCARIAWGHYDAERGTK